MHRIIATTTALVVAVLLGVLSSGPAKAQADVSGITGPTFNLIADDGYITSGDGGSLYFWGYGETGGTAQLSGPTMIVNQGDLVTVNLTNNLSVASSIIFPGQQGVVATGDAPGLLTKEAAAGGGDATYTFTASKPGTYLYQSGTRTDLQVEMGLFGALIVRPTGYDAASNRIAYGHADSEYDHEYLLILSEMDHRIHEAAELGDFAAIDGYLIDYKPVYWFINGRTAVDTLFPDDLPWMPHQPYGSMVRGHPGEKVLLRWIGASKHLHPFHPHGNNALLIARDGALMESSPGAGADLSYSDYTFGVNPGGTWDAVFEWTGKAMGWDIYGPATTVGEEFYHGTCAAGVDDIDDNRTGLPTADGPDADLLPDGDGYHDVTWEWCPNHGEPIPVTLPGLQDLSFGGFWSGSPYLGHFGSLPPGEGGNNLTGGFLFPWHSHSEKELTNFDIFIGGMLTFFVVEPHGVPIP